VFGGQELLTRSYEFGKVTSLPASNVAQSNLNTRSATTGPVNPPPVAPRPAPEAYTDMSEEIGEADDAVEENTVGVDAPAAPVTPPAPAAGAGGALRDRIKQIQGQQPNM